MSGVGVGYVNVLAACAQEALDAIRKEMIRCGKEEGLKSFEQVMMSLSNDIILCH